MQQMANELKSWQERLNNVVASAKATPVTSAQTIHCPYNACDGSGIIMQPNGWSIRDCRCRVDRDEQERIQKLFSELCVPKRYQGKTMDNYDPLRVTGRGYEMAKRYITRFDEIRNESKNSLALIGPPGTGKTHLAYAILNALLPRLRSAICGSVPDLMDLLRPRGEDRDLGKQRLHALKTSELVILDDLGAEVESDWVTERLFLIINARYNEQLPTVITSNVPLKDLERQQGWERIGSRISEMCYAVIVDGEDQRKSKG